MESLSIIKINKVKEFCKKINLNVIMSNIHYDLIFNKRMRLPYADKIVMSFSKNILNKNFPKLSNNYIDKMVENIMKSLN